MAAWVKRLELLIRIQNQHHYRATFELV
jgi:hypothetical protein